MSGTRDANVLVAGVAGAGKSTVGRALAHRLDRPFVDADDHHPPRNQRLMAAGTPLTEEDREPWLRRLAGLLLAAREAGEPVVLACSALRRSHRALLASAAPLVVVFLDVPEDVAEQRVGDRADHFMPDDLVRSQFDALERPDDAVVVDGTAPVAEVVAGLVAALDAGGGTDQG